MDAIFFSPDMLRARILRSLLAHAVEKNIDTGKACKVAGVKAVITHKEVPKRFAMHQFLHQRSVIYYDSYLLEEKVRHFGDRVAAVAATTPEAAEEALSLIEVEYEPLTPVFDAIEAYREGAPKIHTIAQRGTFKSR